MKIGIGVIVKQTFSIRVFPKIGVGPPNHPFVHRGFHYKPSIFGVLPLFLVQHPYKSCDDPSRHKFGENNPIKLEVFPQTIN